MAEEADTDEAPEMGVEDVVVMAVDVVAVALDADLGGVENIVEAVGHVVED